MSDAAETPERVLDVPDAGLRCTTTAAGTTQIVSLDGEVDLHTAPILVAVVDSAFGADPETLVVDLSGVRFIDSTGIHALLDAHDRATAREVRLVLLPAAPEVQLVFRVAGVDALLPFHA
jgi:anti-anti-sigma factor